MRHPVPLRHMIVPLICVASTACAPQAEGSAGDNGAEATEAQSSEEAGGGAEIEVMLVADTAWLSVGTDGSVQTTFLDTGGRYRDFRNGEAADSGSWEQRPDGSICFTPDSGLGACWATESSENDGTAVIVNETGTRVSIKRITYTAPPVEVAETG